MNDKTFCLLLSENCNFACKYCYERSGKGHNKNNMSKEVAMDVLNYIFNQNEEEVILSLFGGEPTMNPSVIDLICTEGKRMAKEQSKRFSVGMITNGSLMNRNLYDIMKKHIDVINDIQLSIDGNKDTQDLTRVKADGSGSFGDVEAMIPYWKALFPNLNIHGVLNKDTMGNLSENYRFFLDEWGIPFLWFLPAKDDRYTMDDVKIYDEEMGKIYDYIMSNVRETKDLTLLKGYQPLNMALNMSDSIGKPCGIGAGYQVITTKGDIWPCHHLYFIDTDNETKMGDIYNGVDNNRSRIWDEYDADDMIGCEECDLTHCFRCPAENFESNGSPFVQITGISCEFMFVDTKYQKLIEKELIEMGLLRKKEEGNGGCGCGCGDESGPTVREYDDVSPNKTGCDIVQRVMSDGTVTDLSGLPASEIPEVENSDDPNTNLKNLLNDMIEVMVSYHNKL